jgi:hypothetical protein
MIAFNADPANRAANAARLKARWGDPIFRATRALKCALAQGCSEAAIGRLAKTLDEAIGEVPAWVPDRWRDLYRKIRLECGEHEAAAEIRFLKADAMTARPADVLRAARPRGAPPPLAGTSQSAWRDEGGNRRSAVSRPPARRSADPSSRPFAGAS